MPRNTYLTDGPGTAGATVILAHGAGAPMDSPLMDAWAAGIADAGLRCVRFEFPYMALRRTGGPRKPPDRLPVLLDAWRQVVDDVGAMYPDTPVFVGGKSLGGRTASLLVCPSGGDPSRDPSPIHGVVCLGYPFHPVGKPAGKPERLRVEHLGSMVTPCIIIQGTRDALGSREDVNGYHLSQAIRVCWLEDGDHGFKPRKASGRTEAQNWQEGIDALVGFVRAHI